MDEFSCEGCESNELRESQALHQFREWIKKHPKIKKCRTDDRFLIRFLRMRNFNIVETCHLLEQYLTTRKQYPHLFENLTIEAPEIESHVFNYGVYPLFDTDSHGRVILFIDSRILNYNRLNPVDSTRFGNLCFEYLSYDERLQTKGIVVIVNASIIDYEFLRLWTPTCIKQTVQCAIKTYPIRVKKIYLVNMAPVWMTLVKLVKIFISDKMKSRIEVIEGWDKMLKELGTNKLSREIGGEIPASEMAADFKNHLLENREYILSLNDTLDIDISYSSGNFSRSYDAELEAGIVGSFRKIALD